VALGVPVLASGESPRPVSLTLHEQTPKKPATTTTAFQMYLGMAARIAPNRRECV
jgi:hypothetical protein